MTSETRGRFRRWFWRPPRAHGETVADRQVSVLELFYDLVYVAVIGQAAHHLAGHVSVPGLAEFAAVFALIQYSQPSAQTDGPARPSAWSAAAANRWPASARNVLAGTPRPRRAPP